MIPIDFPGQIRTDESNPFANHTMRVRVPDIIQQTLDVNPALPMESRSALAALKIEVATGAAIQPLVRAASEEERAWQAAYARRAGETWHSTDWFFAETFVYRRIIEAVDYFSTRTDPFLPIKRHDYSSTQHQSLFDAALAVAGKRDERLHSLIAKDLWGNRVDLSYAESRTHGMATADDDLLVDDRSAILRRLKDRTGTVHVIADNAGTELTLDLVLIDALLSDGWADQVILHVKFHPTFVSDAIADDVAWFLDACMQGAFGDAARAHGLRLKSHLDSGRLSLTLDAYWNSPDLWWQMPAHLLAPLRAASLVFVKGDANYRRVVGDALWPADTPFEQVVANVGISVACIRTSKSDPVVGLPAGLSDVLQSLEPRWRWSGRRGLIQAFLP
ncbi:MAG: protein-glutamate O-methyltransferase family protein [Chloroflexi bacterium]|nr:protein-glutamate O-methyltransferase family protein [Chloroflexota bacterium]